MDEKQKMSLLLTLVKGAVRDQEILIDNTFIDVDWDNLLGFAASQGVVTWAWKGIGKLPINFQPNRQCRISWALSAQKTQDDNRNQQRVLKYLVDCCDSLGIKLLLLKGHSLSLLYPDPDLRPSGDLDVLMLNNQKKGNDFLSEYTYKVSKKHVEYIISNVLVESHSLFFDLIDVRRIVINRYLKQSLRNAVKSDFGYYTFDNKSNLVFLIMHTMVHLVEESDFALRRLYDVPMFINANRSNLPADECQVLLKKLHLHKSFELLISVGEWILDMDFSEYHSDCVPSSIKEMAKRTIVYHENMAVIPSDVSFVNQLLMTVNRNIHQYWKYYFMYVSVFKRLYIFVLQQGVILMKKLLKLPQEKSLYDALFKYD